jgi:hypothetical protein
LYLRPALAVALVAWCMLSYGCGYIIQGKANLPFQAVGIGRIMNKTYEPKLEDKIQIALVEELLKNGITFESGSGFRIDGVINRFDLVTLSEKNGVTVLYEVIIKGDFRLVEPSGKTKPLRGSGVFIVSFQSSENLQGVIASKELAIDRALRDLSTEIVASMIYP